MILVVSLAPISGWSQFKLLQDNPAPCMGASKHGNRSLIQPIAPASGMGVHIRGVGSESGTDCCTGTKIEGQKKTKWLRLSICRKCSLGPKELVSPPWVSGAQFVQFLLTLSS